MLGSLEFLSDIPATAGIALAILLAGLAWWLYRRETQGSVTSPLNWILPSLRAAAVALIVVTLLEPVIESEQREGQPGRVLLAIDASESMSLVEDEGPNALSRLQRATKSLGGEAGLIAALQDRFDVSVQSIGDNGELQLLWDSSEEQSWQEQDAALDEDADRPESLAPALQSPLASSTAIGTTLQNIGKAQVGAENNTVVVLLSDGQNNTGAAPIAAAEELPEGVSVFPFGFGPAEETPDLFVAQVQTASRIFSEGNLLGKVTISERIPEGRSYSVQVEYSGKVLWEQNVTSKRESAREVAFAFPVQKLLDIATSANASVEYASLPVKLEVRVKSLDDRIESNNVRAAYTSVITQRAKLLLIDGRSRWETRYIKNMFTRDSSWDLTSVILKPDYSLLRDETLKRKDGRPAETSAEATSQLPRTKAELFEYDLVFLGDVPPERMPVEFFEHLAEFVSIRGGGLICIDGVRGNLKDEGYETLREVFPVRWSDSKLEGDWKAELTELGEPLSALQLDEDVAASSQFWQELPEVEFLASVEAQLGAEVLLEAKRGSISHPLVVTRRFGAGRVLYLATDETWRWRFEEADKVHTRIWNQWVRWSMSQPYSQSNDYIALDTGEPSYEFGESVEIRCRLRDDSGMPRSGKSVTAVVEDSNGKQRRFVLEEHPEVEGSYRALAADLPAGDYRVRLEAAGFPAEALRLESEFGVLQPVSLEMSATTCNVGLLEEIAKRSGGEYFAEDEMEELIQAIRPRSGGKILLSTMILWQSYWWFCAALLLLVVEWSLRKRAGLI